MTPKRSVQPRQRGPIGRKCYAWRDRRVEYAEVIAQYRDVPDDMPVRPVLVLGRDPANVERIREEVHQCINWWFDGESDYQTCLSRSTEDILYALSLTPARRRGKKLGKQPRKKK